MILREIYLIENIDPKTKKNKSKSKKSKKYNSEYASVYKITPQTIFLSFRKFWFRYDENNIKKHPDEQSYRVS